MRGVSASEIWDDLLPRIETLLASRLTARTSGGASGVDLSSHSLSGALHTGVLADSQGPQFLLRGGGRSLTGDWAVDDGVKIDGVDISAHVGNANAHHNQSHVLATALALGPDHSISGATAGHVLRASGATTALFAELQHADLGSVTTDQHHAKLHAMLDTDHHSYSGGAALDVFGLSAASTLAKLTPSYDVSAGASALLRSNSGALGVATLTAGTKVTTPLIDTASGDIALSPAANLVLSPVGYVSLADGKTIRSDNFNPGWTGNGWQITEASGATDIEVDNLSVRGLMRVYELLIHKIRTGNGSYLFSDGGKVLVVSGAGPYTLDFEEDHGFTTGDLLLAQKFTGSGTYQSKLTVTGTPTTKQITATLYSGAAPAAGYEYVRIGNSSDANRRGSVYITADDSGAPFVDVVDGVAAHTDWYSATKIKARLGKLDGMTYAGGSISGYGLYSDNVYLSGRLRAGGGIARADDNGFAVTVKSSVAYDDLNAYTMERGDGSTLGGMYGWESGTSAAIDLRVTAANAAHTANVGLYASNSMAGTVQAQVAATASDGSAYLTLTKGQVYLQATLGAATKSITLDYNGLTLPSLVGIGQSYTTGWGLALTGRQLLQANGRGTTYETMALELKTTDNTPPGIGFHRSGYSAVALYEYQEQLWIKNSAGYVGKIWHSDNGGAGSGLDAGKLAGKLPTALAAWWDAVPFVASDGVMEIGKYIDFHETSAHAGDYSHRITCDSGRLVFSGDVTLSGSGEHRIGHAGDTYSYHQVVENSRYKIGCWDVSDGGKLLTLNESGGSVAIGATAAAGTSKLHVEGEIYSTTKIVSDGAVWIKEISAPSGITGYGALYTKSDNKLYFKDGDGTEHTVAYV